MTCITFWQTQYIKLMAMQFRGRFSRLISPLLVSLLMVSACTPAAEAPQTPTKAVGDKSGVQEGTKPLASVKAIDQLTAGSYVTGTLTSSDRQFKDDTYFDVWPYSGTAGEEVTFTQTSDNFDTYLIVRLLNSASLDDAVEVASDDDSAGDLNSTLTVTLPETGTYAVIANAAVANAQGAYRLSASSNTASSRPSVSSTGLMPIQTNSVVSGSLASGDRTLSEGAYADMYTFEAQSGALITTDVSSSDFDAMVYIGRVVNGDIVTLTSDDDSAGGTNARAEWRVEEGGEYVVAASAFEGGLTGPYMVSVNLTRPIDYAARYPGGGDPNGRYAVLVGIDDYPGTGSDLPSSVDDVIVFREMLIADLGFSEENIVTITDQEAYRDHIISAFERHLGQAGPGGSAVFYYSGHGTQLDENVGSDVEADGKDEAIYVWGTDFRGSVLIDEEIGALANRLATTRVLVVLDACNSGTGTRGGGGAFPIKEVRYEDIKSTTDIPMTVVSNKGMAGAPGGPNDDNNDIVNGPRGHVLLGAAADSESALASSEEWPEIGRKASVFTYYLTQSIKTMGTGATWVQIMNDVRPKTANYSAAKDNSQTVQLEGVAGTQSIAEFFGM
jgi:Caspase domain